MDTFSEFKFISTYYVASYIREMIIKNDPLDYISDYFDVSAQEEQFLNPSKETLLHGYINQEFVKNIEYSHKFFSEEQMVEEWTTYLDSYKIVYPTYEKFIKDGNYPDEEEENEYLYDYGVSLTDLIIEKVAPLVTKEVFSILFRDRKLLMEFNKLLSDIITELKVSQYPDLLSKDGIVKRCTYWPEWTKSYPLRIYSVNGFRESHNFLNVGVHNGFNYAPCAILVSSEDGEDFEIVQAEWGYVPGFENTD